MHVPMILFVADNVLVIIALPYVWSAAESLDDLARDRHLVRANYCTD